MYITILYFGVLHLFSTNQMWYTVNTGRMQAAAQHELSENAYLDT